MSLELFSRGALRVAKNYTKGYSDVQVKVRNATSNDPWGPTGTGMNELAELTYNQQDFAEIMEMLDKRLNDKGKNWRHVFKSLTVLDYLLHAGSENVVLYFQDNLYTIKALREFQYIDEHGKDQGSNVRQKAKDIAKLLMDESRLRKERRFRAHMRNGVLDDDPVGTRADFENENVRRSSENSQAGAQKWRNQEQEDLEKALALSRQSLADETRRAAYVAQQQETARLQELWDQRRLQQQYQQQQETARLQALWDQRQQQALQQQQQQQEALLEQQQQNQEQQETARLQVLWDQHQQQQTLQQQHQQQALLIQQQQQAQWAAFQQQQQANLFVQPTVQAQPMVYRSDNPWDLQEANHLFEEEERRLKAIEDSNSRALFDDGTAPAGPPAQRNSPFTLVDTSLPNAQQTELHPQYNPFFKETQQTRELTVE
ncbi:hypothetical protein FRC04_006025 [Tulasnella sp. 424]|nr:hypothetical protein FRC04_006025 [Tulasnella sp. 424]